MKVSKFIQNKANLKNKAVGYKDGKIMTRDPWREEFGAAYSIHSEAKDFSKWVIQLMKEEGLSKESYKSLFDVQYQFPEGHPYLEQGVSAWTLGFAKAQFGPVELYGHGGNNQGFTSIFLMARQQKWGMVFFTNADQVSDFGFELMGYLNQ